MKNFREIGFFLLIQFFCLQSISCQTTISKKAEKWDFNISLGYYAGGPSNDLKDFLHASGYNWNLSTKKYLPYKVEINRRIKNNFLIGVSLSSFKQSLIWTDYGWDNSRFKTVVLAPFMSYNFDHILYIGIGPSLNKTSYYHPTGTSLTDEGTYLKVGFTLKSTLKIPRKARVYLLLEVNYDYGGTISTYYHIEIPGHQYHFTNLNADKLSTNFLYVGAGIGFRLFK